MLMDLFFTSVRESGAVPCKRVHFHDWLLAVHEELVRSAIFRSVRHLPSRFQGVSVGCLDAQHECFAVNARVPSPAVQTMRQASLKRSRPSTNPTDRLKHQQVCAHPDWTVSDVDWRLPSMLSLLNTG